MRCCAQYEPADGGRALRSCRSDGGRGCGNNGCAVERDGGSRSPVVGCRSGAAGAGEYRRRARGGQPRPVASWVRRATRLLHRDTLCYRRWPQGERRRARRQECCGIRPDEAADRQLRDAGGDHVGQLQTVSCTAADADISSGVRRRGRGFAVSRSRLCARRWRRCAWNWCRRARAS